MKASTEKMRVKARLQILKGVLFATENAFEQEIVIANNLFLVIKKTIAI